MGWRSIILAAAAAGQAQAQEVFPLSSHGHWDVSYVSSEAGPYCSASVTGDGLYLSVDVSKLAGITVFIIDNEKNWIDQTGLTMFAQVDARSPWEVGSVITYDHVSQFALQGDAGFRFLGELSDGRVVQFDYNEQGTPPNYSDVTFSLLGSGAAMAALAECAGRL